MVPDILQVAAATPTSPLAEFILTPETMIQRAAGWAKHARTLAAHSQR
jgi:hypothetical protein